MKRYVIIFLQVTIVFLVYYLLSSVVNDYLLLVIFISLTLAFVGYGYTGRKNYTFYLDSLCDVEKHLEFIQAKLENKDQSLYLLYTAYGNVFNGDFENIESDISKIDLSVLNLKERFFYEEIKLKLLYNNKDTEGYERKFEEISKGDFEKTFSNKLLILRAPLMLLKEEYTELVDLMFEIIPKQKQSYRVIELEYYLSVAYIALGKEDDAEAVLEFVTKRNFKLDQVVKGQALLNKIRED